MEHISDDELTNTSVWLKKASNEPSNKNFKLLIVDDQPEIRNLLELTLNTESFEIHHANNCNSALAMTRIIRPDLVLLDVMMPGEFDGLEVCRRIKNDPEVSSALVVIISARSQVADKYKGLEAGADDYIVKPFSPLSLIEKVNVLLAKKEQSL